MSFLVYVSSCIKEYSTIFVVKAIICFRITTKNNTCQAHLISVGVSDASLTVLEHLEQRCQGWSRCGFIGHRAARPSLGARFLLSIIIVMLWPNGIIFHQPMFFVKKRVSFKKPPFGGPGIPKTPIASQMNQQY